MLNQIAEPLRHLLTKLSELASALIESLKKDKPILQKIEELRKAIVMTQ
jgi:hypothetical protein